MRIDRLLAGAWRSAGRRLGAFLRGGPVVESHRAHRGSVLPPPELRMGGPEYEDDEYFLASAASEARRLVSELDYHTGQLLVDLGCGQGRLPIGLLHMGLRPTYLGLDVSSASVHWCRHFIQREHPSCRFLHVDVLNARYNPAGQSIAPDFQLPVPSRSADVVYMWGVLTNMEPEHLPLYAGEISRMLRPGGRAFVTAHVEDGVPVTSINPSNYTPYPCHGPLHCVRYERNHFFRMFDRVGLALTKFVYHGSGNAQSDIYFVKPSSWLMFAMVGIA